MADSTSRCARSSKSTRRSACRSLIDTPTVTARPSSRSAGTSLDDAVGLDLRRASRSLRWRRPSAAIKTCPSSARTGILTTETSE